MLSPMQKQLLGLYDDDDDDGGDDDDDGKFEKLIPNLYDKKYYILHYRNLQLYLSLGLKLKKVIYSKIVSCHDYL